VQNIHRANLSAYDKINVGSSVKQQLANDLGLEEGALVVLKGGIQELLGRER
jgi:bacterioferritin (cytochrome b1)